MNKYCWHKETGELLVFSEQVNKDTYSFQGVSSKNNYGVREGDVITDLRQYYNDNFTFGEDYMKIVTCPDSRGSYERSVFHVAFKTSPNNSNEYAVFTRGEIGTITISAHDIHCIEILNNKQKNDGTIKLSKKTIRVVKRKRTTGRVPILSRGVVKHLTR